MKNYLDDRKIHIPSGCGIIGIMSTKGNLIEGTKIVSGIYNMKERGNGLGSGFAGYGIYPEFKDYYCFHIMYQKENAVDNVENFLKINFDIIDKQP
ncbi:MAG: hypothetical protein N2555_02305, partial [Endomicrobia bacterium]|nr:hypothetical protein [Endomicrobiia bacterium]